MTAQDFAAQTYKTPFIYTYTGKRVNPLNLRPEDICIEDIAHHLATINRWCGALREPMSVAQHSVHVSWLCEGTGFQLEGLLHDASEAYLGDVTKWLKGTAGMAAYRDAEDRAMDVIGKKFNVQLNPLPLKVEEADKTMVGVEAYYGIPNWEPPPGYNLPTPEILQKSKCEERPWPWKQAEYWFEYWFKVLSAMRAQ